MFRLSFGPELELPWFGGCLMPVRGGSNREGALEEIDAAPEDLVAIER